MKLDFSDVKETKLVGEGEQSLTIIGAKEAQDKAVTVRLRDGKNLNGLPLADVIAKMKEEADSRSLSNLLK